MLDDINKIDELVKYSYTYGSSVALTWQRLKEQAEAQVTPISKESTQPSSKVCGPSCPWCGKWLNVTIERSV
jgi:hypothetical protein